MSDISLVLLGAGDSTRFGSGVKKQWISIDNKPLWKFVADRFEKIYNFEKIVIAFKDDEIGYAKYFSNKFIFVTGGKSRQESLNNALDKIDSKYVMVSDIARACVPKKIVLNLIKNKNKANCIVPILDVSDTVIYENNTINRDKTKLIQTPQLSQTDILKKALKTDIDFTDDSSAIKNIGGSVFYIKGSIKSHKLTFKKDIKKLPCLRKNKKENLIGFGYDMHKFDFSKKYLKLGGVKFECGFGFVAHSDGDVLIHSLIDAVLGAIGAGDIGEFFPDNDDRFKDVDSVKLLEYIKSFYTKVGFKLKQVDITIVAQTPKINPSKKNIRFRLSDILEIDPIKINIKATTSEGLGFIGEKKALEVKSIVVMERV